MKKVLLSVMTFMAIAISANASDLLYTAEGSVRSALIPVLNDSGDTIRVDTLGIGGYTWDSVYSPLVTLDSPRTVEVYDDRIIVNDWYGYGVNENGNTYALICELTDGVISGFSSRIGETESAYYGYVWTGYEENDNMLVGFSKWTESYAAFTQCEMDNEAKAGYIFLYGTEWYSGREGYYFVTWGNADSFFEVSEGSTGISQYIADPVATRSSASYNLAGQRVSADAKGLVIKNGKKLFQK